MASTPPQPERPESGHSPQASAGLVIGGESAAAEAHIRELQLQLVTEQVAGLEVVRERLRREAANFRVGAAGEAQVVRTLLSWADTDWCVLADRRWPGTRRANIDVIVVGPGGLFVIDVKTWRHARVADGTVWHGQVDEADQVAKVREQADAVGDLLVALGYPPSQVTALMVLTRQTLPATQIGGVTVVGEHDLHRVLARMGTRLTSEHVGRLVAALDSSCPPMPRETARATPPTSTPKAADRPANTEQGALIDPEQVYATLEATARSGPIESWMVWLHPTQSVHVGRGFNGPARISGAAGTGKTVLALHRAKYLAEHTVEKVLVTSHVRNLPSVQRLLFERLAPDLADRVEFRSLHQWAARLLRERGVSIRVDASAAETAFNRAWIAVGRGSALERLSVGPQYWRDEVMAVIKGRAITEPEVYYDLKRVGRQTPLTSAHREIVWQLFQTYEECKADRGVNDWPDLLLAARKSVHAEPVVGYGAVVVDEVQDLTVVGVQLLHNLVGDRTNGLLLVGDGQQSVYAGGYTAAEAGINIVGRSTVLRRNYRNAAAIIERALQVVASMEFADLDSDPESGNRELEVDRSGGVVKEIRADNERSIKAAALSHIEDLMATGTNPGEIAVLCPNTTEVGRWLRTLRTHGLPVMALADYDGHAENRVKVGTYHRCKGLEFAHVLIPGRHLTREPRVFPESDAAGRERAELEKRQLFVAMTRARDGLWVATLAERDGQSGPPPPPPSQ